MNTFEAVLNTCKMAKCRVNNSHWKLKVAQQAVLLMSLCWRCWWYFWWGRLIWCPLVICWCWWISIRHWRGAPKHPDKSLNFFDTTIPDSSFFVDFSKQFASHFSSAKTPTWGIVYEGWGHSRQTIVASWAPVDYHELSSIEELSTLRQATWPPGASGTDLVGLAGHSLGARLHHLHRSIEEAGVPGGGLGKGH